jgi:hypothetical protein
MCTLRGFALLRASCHRVTGKCRPSPGLLTKSNLAGVETALSVCGQCVHRERRHRGQYHIPVYSNIVAVRPCQPVIAGYEFEFRADVTENREFTLLPRIQPAITPLMSLAFLSRKHRHVDVA